MVFILFFILVFSSYNGVHFAPSPSLIVLGTVQDAGSPHIACERDCCRDLFDKPDPTRKVVSLGLVDPDANKKFLFEATPDLPEQMKMLKGFLPDNGQETPDGIFLTHAHIGHYTGLMFLGREGLGAKDIPVYAMPGMRAFLESNGPWSQLVKLQNIDIKPLANGQPRKLTPHLSVTPFTVPHRDEFSETVGYRIDGPNRSALFIPDIDKWSKWDKSIVEEVAQVDYALIDATFNDAGDIRHRDISEIPHPFVIETMALFDELPAAEKAKIHFIHINHSNPLLDPDSEASLFVERKGFQVARYGKVLTL